MKSEERHHLKENDLQNALLHAKPFVEKYSTWIITLGVAVVVAALFYLWINRPPSSATAEAASGMITAGTQDDYAEVANNSDYEGMVVAKWARLKEAEMQLSSGTMLIFSDRAGAVSDLKKALENYDKVIANTKDNELLEQAMYGRGCALEALSEGDTSEAIKAFEDFLTTFGGSVYASDVQERLQRLQKPNVQGLYKWMAANAGKPVAEQGPNDGLANPLDNILQGLPTGDAPLGPAMPAPSEGDSAAPAEETPATEETPAEESATEEPVTEEPVTEEPATEESTEEAPAEEAPPETSTDEEAPAENAEKPAQPE